MNSSSGARRDPARRVSLAHAHLVWDEHGRVSIEGRDGSPVGAGDGIAVAITEMIRRGDAAEPSLRVLASTPMPPLAARERDVGDDVDMTNWNVVVDDSVIVKLIGRLGDGDRAVRQVRAISRHAPETVPTLYGALELRCGEEWRVVATATALVPHALDGWTWAVADLLAFLDGGPAPAWPRETGAMIAALHAALYRETGPMNGLDPADALIREAHHQLEEVIDAGSPTGVRLAARRHALRAAMDGIVPPSAGRFAVHGDLHVGQLLRAPDGVVRVIDFDGDPQGGADLDSADAALDLAHLLVSVDLVGAIAVKRRGVDDTRILQWCTRARQELLAGYQDRARALDHSPGLDLDRLAALEAVQCIRELTYSRDFLPRWTYAPDWAIAHRYAPSPDLEDPPWTPPASPQT